MWSHYFPLLHSCVSHDWSTVYAAFVVAQVVGLFPWGDMNDLSTWLTPTASPFSLPVEHWSVQTARHLVLFWRVIRCPEETPSSSKIDVFSMVSVIALCVIYPSRFTTGPFRPSHMATAAAHQGNNFSAILHPVQQFSCSPVPSHRHDVAGIW